MFTLSETLGALGVPILLMALLLAVLSTASSIWLAVAYDRARRGIIDNYRRRGGIVL